ncbi:MAG: PIN domain-containing protein [Anaerolineae bacterium]
MALKYVLDTHPLVWYLEGNPRLSQKAKAVIDDQGSDLVLPIIALAEATFIVERGRTGIPSVSDLLVSVQSDPRIEVYPLSLAILQRSLDATMIPEMHDRLILATAMQLHSLGHTVSLLTKDAFIARSGLAPIIW